MFTTSTIRPPTDDVPWLSFHDGHIKVTKHLLLRHLREDHALKVTDEGIVYAYNQDEGICEQRNHQTLCALIKGHIPEEIRSVKLTEELYKELMTDMPNVKVYELNAREDLIAFADGVLSIPTGEFLPHSAEYLHTRKLPCRYLANATLEQAPVFNKFMHDLLGDDNPDISTLLEFMGGVMSNVYGWRFKKMLLLIGPGGTGKSKWRELLMRIVGDEHCMSIDLTNLVARFGAATLIGKRLGGSGDLSSVDLEEISIIKNLTGGDSTFSEQKCVQGKSFRFDGYLLFVTNVLPYWRGDRGSHVYERFMIVRTAQPIPVDQRDPNLLEKMLVEKEIIANVAIQHLIGAVKRGYHFSESEFIDLEREQYQVANNSLLSFVSLCCNLKALGRTTCAEFYKFYKIWCLENNVRPERKKDAVKQLAEHFHIEPFKSYTELYDLEILPEVRRELEALITPDNRRRR